MRLSILLTMVLTLPAGPLAAQDYVVETVLTGLNNPHGVAIRPGGNAVDYEVFVAESGAQRIIKFSNRSPQRTDNVISEFPALRLGPNQGYRIGPLALLFLDREHLVVAGGGEPTGDEIVRLFVLPEDELLVTADTMTQSAGPLAGEARIFFSLARTKANGYVPDLVLVTSQGKDGRGWILKVPIRAGTLGKLETYISTTQLTGSTSPTGMAVSEKGYLAVAQMGTVEVPHDSVLGIYNPLDGSLIMHCDTELNDISSLAYSPTTGNLYATDFSWNDPAAGGVFRIDASTDSTETICPAVRIATLTHPAGLAFAPDGTLYVATFGDTDGTETNRGAIVKITGNL